MGMTEQMRSDIKTACKIMLARGQSAIAATLARMATREAYRDGPRADAVKFDDELMAIFDSYQMEF
jgi:hypothetical protein